VFGEVLGFATTFFISFFAGFALVFGGVGTETSFVGFFWVLAYSSFSFSPVLDYLKISYSRVSSNNPCSILLFSLTEFSGNSPIGVYRHSGGGEGYNKKCSVLNFTYLF